MVSKKDYGTCMCAYCGDVFVKRSSTNKYCCIECATAANGQRSHERYMQMKLAYARSLNEEKTKKRRQSDITREKKKRDIYCPVNHVDWRREW